MAHVTTAHPAVLAKKKRAPLPRSLQRFFLEKKLTRPPPEPMAAARAKWLEGKDKKRNGNVHFFVRLLSARQGTPNMRKKANRQACHASDHPFSFLFRINKRNTKKAHKSRIHRGRCKNVLFLCIGRSKDY